LSKEQVESYSKFSSFLKSTIQKVAARSATWAALKRWGQFSNKSLSGALEWNKGPSLTVTNDESDLAGGVGSYNWKSKKIYISQNLVLRLEYPSTMGDDEQILLIWLEATVLHELVHWGNGRDNVDDVKGEEGDEFERDAYGNLMRDKDAADKEKRKREGKAKQTEEQYQKEQMIWQRYDPAAQ
jgi:hypothetical protein